MPSRLLAVFFIALSFILGSGCNDIGQPIGIPEPSGTFAYNGYDLSANVILTGTIHLYRQGQDLSGERDLRTPQGVVDSGQIGGTVQPDASIEVMFDPNKLQLFYVVLIGKPSTGAITGDVFSSGERAIIKTGTFKLLPLN